VNRSLAGLGAAVLAAPMVIFLITTNVDGWDPIWVAPDLHFYVVSATTLLSAAVATGLMLCVRSVRTTRTVLLALGFLALALIFATHGLSTPGFIRGVKEERYAVIISAGLSEFVCAAFIFLSVLPRGSLAARVVDAVRGPLVGAAFVAVAGYVYVAMAEPQWLEVIPINSSWDLALALSTVAMLTFAGWRYWRAWRLTGFPSQFAMVAALAFLAQAQVSMFYGTLWHASWWLYHGLLLTAFLTLIAGWAVEAARAHSLLLFSRAIALRDELDRVSLADPDSLEALELAMEAKDQYTHEHMGRVAEYAGAIARELHLDAETIEVVEVAGRIHDIGKIVVPDSVLMKPGRLTDSEFAQMRDHSSRGEHIAKSSKVLAGVATVIRSHHERYGGHGYPDGITNEQIPLAARIIAVADTFDALTSPRVYRAERDAEAAFAEIQRVSGTQLDPRCVSAFRACLEREGTLAARAQAA
jgi:HD-GYP domain-containing protein (c-di-GMP phosphodiesterase class II)